jgi:hypothetical protein
MTVRDPYTGVERLAPSRPRSFASRWWPVALFVAIAVAGGGVEWRNSMVERAPHPAATASAPQLARGGTAVGTSPTTAAETPPAGNAATTQTVANDDLIVALNAMATASDRLANYSVLILLLAALQAIVLAGQLYLFGKQLQAARDKAK